MTSGIYNKHRADLQNGEIDLEADDITVMLMDSDHAFSATDNVISDVSANEISGTGYTAGGQSLANLSVVQGDPTNFDADDAVWTDATFSAYHAVIYNNTTSNLISSIDFGEEKPVSQGDFTISWDAAGIITIS